MSRYKSLDADVSEHCGALWTLEPQLGPYEERSNFPSCSTCKNILCGKNHWWEQLQGCKILMLWNIKMQDLDFWRC